MVVEADMKITAQPSAEVGGLADVEQTAHGIVKEVNTRRPRQATEERRPEPQTERVIQTEELQLLS